jgi:hypothetical protein
MRLLSFNESTIVDYNDGPRYPYSRHDLIDS